MISGRHHIGAGDKSLLHQIPHADVDKIRHAGTADRRYSAFQRGTQLRQRCDVDVCINQSRQHHSAMQIEHARAGWRGVGADGFDASIAKNNRHIALK